MMICTFYAHETGFDRIVNILHGLYPKVNISTGTNEGFQLVEMTFKTGLFGSSQKISISYRQRNILSYKLPEMDDSLLTKNVKGLYGYVYSLPAQNEQIKAVFLRKIETVNAEFSLFAEKATDSELRKIATALAQEFDAILFVQPDTAVSKSLGQHFLDKNLQLLLDSEGNCMVEDLKVNIKYSYFDGDKQLVSKEQLERKERSEAIIQQKAIKINKHLPVIETEEQVVTRSAAEIAQRLCVMAVINMVATDYVPATEAIDYLQQYNLWAFTTPVEKDLLANPTKEKKTRESWRCEGLYVMFWALNKVDALSFPDTIINMSEAGIEQYPVGEDVDPNDFINSVTGVRSNAEILDMNDLYYRLDWACVDARLNNLSIESLHPAVVYERHYALNWLINYMDQDWDDITCDT